MRFHRMQLNSIVDALNAEPSKKAKGRLFQSGVKFRSLCQQCNRDVVGTLYDPELVEFSNSVSQYLHSQVALPVIGSFTTRPGILARAVAAHILAIGVEQFPRGKMGDAMADLVLDPNAHFPDKLGIYYWLYPYWDQVSIRGCSYLPRFGAPPLIMSILKFTPLAFMVTWDAHPGFKFPHMNLCDSIAGAGLVPTQVWLNFRSLPHQRYPEAPVEDGAVLIGSEAYLAERRR